MSADDRLRILESHVAQLSEIFDAVQVCGSFLTPDGKTLSQKRGSGNWYARQGMCKEFIDENQAEDAAQAIARKLKPPDDYGIQT